MAPDRYGDGAVAAACIHACLPRLTLTLRLRPAALHLRAACASLLLHSLRLQHGITIIITFTTAN